MTNQTQAPAPAGRVTIDDVRTALGDVNPNTTNASKVRSLLGRGSFETIQKHLETLRAERAPTAPAQAGATPAAPAETLAAIWSAAWQSAQVQTLGRLEAVTVERDALTAALSTARADVVELAGEVDTLTDDVTIAQSDLEVAKTALKAVMDRGTADASSAADVLAAVRAELAKVQADAQHAQALSVRDAALAAAAMQVTINRLTDQVGELKSLVHAQ